MSGSFAYMNTNCYKHQYSRKLILKYFLSKKYYLTGIIYFFNCLNWFFAVNKVTH